MTKFEFKAVIALFFILLQISGSCFSQEITQVIRGRVTDRESGVSLPGASIILVSDSGKFTGVTSDEHGYYRLENVPVGRQTIRVTFIGYESMLIPDIIVSSGKESLIHVELEESAFSMQEVEIQATRKDQPINEMAIISTRTFSVEETDKYAGSRGDPARMASNFAGVQGADDSRNDIVIRGNSPMGVLWRVEGVDIPNPNHFAIAGTAGGPVSIINNKSLSNSDFYTGAFPAEFGNTISGVFDLRLRNGNNEKHEFTGQFGFLGTELMAEGPLSGKNKSSYLIGYRYSTLSIFSVIGIDIGTTAIPKYQDMFFKMNFPGKKGGNLAVFAIGGLSDIDIMISEQEKPEREIYGEKDRDQFFGTGMGIAGVTYTKSFNSSTYGKFTIAHSLQDIHSRHELIYRHVNSEGLYVIDSMQHKLGYTFLEGQSAMNGFINKKIGSRHVLKFGANLAYRTFSFNDSVFDELNYRYINRLDAKEGAVLAQPFFQWKYRISEKLTLNSGLHSQYFSLSNSISPLEPRAGIKYDLTPKSTLSAGLGMHSQIQPSYIYLHHIPAANGSMVMHNRNLDFTRSLHYVLAYDQRLASNLRLKLETYYQQLYGIPVEVKPSSFSLVNQGTGFVRFFPDSLANKGTGENYGVELTLEKFFSKKYFFMSTVSLYESTYRGSDGIRRDSDFNGNYIYNFLTAKEFKTGSKSALTVGTKVTGAGGRRYSPVDIAASEASGEIAYVDSLRNSLQMRQYFRTDLKINYRINAKKVTHELALDLVNIFGTKNVLKLTYAPDPADPTANPVREEYQLGFLPIFYYKIDF